MIIISVIIDNKNISNMVTFLTNRVMVNNTSKLTKSGFTCYR